MTKQDFVTPVAPDLAPPLDHWVKPCSQTNFWHQLAKHLDNAKTYEQCVSLLQGYFKVNGSPSGRALRELVNAAVQKKAAPKDFLQAWDRRRGRMPLAEQVERATDGAAARPMPPMDAPAAAPAVEIVRVDTISGWPLAIVAGEEKPRLSHRVLAERLGYADPKNILDLADAALGADWKLRATSAEFRSGSRGPSSREWLWDRRQVLEVTMLARGPNAAAIRGQVLNVFEAWLDGQRPAAVQSATSDLPPWARSLLEVMGHGVMEAKAIAGAASARVEEVAKDSEAARGDAAAARLAAEDARARADEVRHLIEQRATAPLPAPPPGWRIDHDVAHEFKLPSLGPGAQIIESIVDERGMLDDENLVRRCASGNRRRSAIALSPRCIELVAASLRAASHRMFVLGYTVPGRAMVARDDYGRPSSKSFVREQMLEAARKEAMPQLPLSTGGMKRNG